MNAINSEMSGTALAVPDHHLLKEVMAYQHDPLVGRIQKKLDITDEKARQIFEETKRFLFLCGTCPGDWSPSRDIDEGWHNFIMFTKDYMTFCQKFFGRYIHHLPNLPGQVTDRNRPRRTLVAAMQLFGRENLSEHWTYCNASGKPVLGPSVPESPTLAAMDPCNSCGCDSSCKGD